MADDILIAQETGFIYYGDGERALVRKGITRVRVGHPMIAGNESMFKPVDVHYDVEQVSTPPGEPRPATKATKRA